MKAVKNYKKRNAFMGFWILLLLLAGVSSCTKYEPKNVRARFINETGYTLTKVKIGNRYVGRLQPNEKTKYLPFTAIEIDGNAPVIDISANIGKVQAKNSFEHLWCGTGRTSVSEGTFEFVILKFERENGFSLYISGQ